MMKGATEDPHGEANTLLNHALSYANLNWSVIPIKPKGKRPLIKWEEYQKIRATEKQITNWWSKWPNANIGIITGLVSGLIVIDVDSNNGREGYIAIFKEMHNTIEQKTGKPDAIQMFFRHPGDQLYQNMVGLLPEVDVRADGGYVVVPPSIHPNGIEYSWVIDPIEMGLNDLLELPGELRSKLITQETSERKNIEGWVSEALLGVEEGKRTNTCVKLAGYYLRKFENDAEQTQILLQSWNERNTPPMDWKVIDQTVQSIVKREAAKIKKEAGEIIEKIEILDYPDNSRRSFIVFLKGYNKSIEINIDTLLTFIQFKKRFAEATLDVLKPIKQDKWDTILRQMLPKATIKFMSCDETPDEIIADYINRRMLEDPTTLDRLSNSLVIDNSLIHLRIQPIVDSLLSHHDHLTRKEIGRILRRFGFENKITRIQGESLRCWVTPIKSWRQRKS